MHLGGTVKLYWYPLSGHAHRAQLFLSLLQIPHERIVVDLAAGAQRDAAFRALNPMGQVPLLVDGDAIIADSNAILVYLAEKHAPESWYPRDPVSRAQVQRWLSLAAGELAAGPAAARLITVFGAQRDQDRIAALCARLLPVLSAALEGRDWLLGDQPTIADVAMYTYTAHAPEGNVDLSPWPNILAWLRRVEALPGFVPMQPTAVGLLSAS